MKASRDSMVCSVTLEPCRSREIALADPTAASPNDHEAVPVRDR